MLKGHSECVTSVVFSPDSMRIVSASKDKTARIWNTATGECELELKGYSDHVNSALFSSDGMHIVSACDNSAWIWNMATGECEAVWEGYTSIPSLSENRQLPLIPNGVFMHSHFKGQISISSQPSFLDLYDNTIFHTVNLRKICLPPPFQNPFTITCYLSKICLTYKSGEILLLDICVA